MRGYEITFSFTALCPCCGKELPPSSYLTESKPTGHPLERDNPYERKDRRVFITPCQDCFEWKGNAGGGENGCKAQPCVECDCTTAINPDGARRTYCSSDQMMRAIADGTAGAVARLAAKPVGWRDAHDHATFYYEHPGEGYEVDPVFLALGGGGENGRTSGGDLGDGSKS